MIDSGVITKENVQNLIDKGKLQGVSVQQCILSVN